MADGEVNYGLFDAENPRALINIVPGELRRSMLQVDRQDLLLDDRSLRRKVKPSDLLNRLRLNFWLEFTRAQDSRSMMNMNNIHHGVSHRTYLYETVLPDPLRVAWLITPPVDFTLVQMDILHAGLDRLAAVTRKDLYIVKEIIRKDGTIERTRRIDVQALGEQRKIVELMMDRVHGSVVRRVAIKQQVLGDSPAELYGEESLTVLAGQIEDLKRVLPPPPSAPAPNSEGENE